MFIFLYMSKNISRGQWSVLLTSCQVSCLAEYEMNRPCGSTTTWTLRESLRACEVWPWRSCFKSSPHPSPETFPHSQGLYSRELQQRTCCDWCNRVSVLSAWPSFREGLLSHWETSPCTAFSALFYSPLLSPALSCFP